jgi:hypothetical protein
VTIAGVGLNYSPSTEDICCALFVCVVVVMIGAKKKMQDDYRERR